MKLGVLFSGGKDSCYAAWLAKKSGYELSCLITIFSENPDSYMFHTPLIELTKKQAGLMCLPIITKKTKGKKESELADLELTIKLAIKKYKIQGIVTGAIESIYQSSRIHKICNKLGIECFNPLWQKDQIEYLHELIDNNFKVIITKVAADGLDGKWLNRVINKSLIKDITRLNEKYKIHLAGEGGEFETLVVNCPLFMKLLNEIKL